MILSPAFATLLHGNDDLNIQAITLSTGTRIYYYTQGDTTFYVPSVTTVLKAKPKPGLDKWRKRVGEANAKLIASTAAIRGEVLHSAAETFLRTGDDPIIQNPAHGAFWEPLKHQLQPYQGLLVAYEHPLLHPGLRVIGRFDLVVACGGGYKVLDVKGSSICWLDMSDKLREDKSSDYLMQLAVYWHAMVRWNLPMVGAEILMASDGWCQRIPLPPHPKSLLMDYKALYDTYVSSEDWQTSVRKVRQMLQKSA